MALFSYRAINEDSKEVRGTIDAADLQSAKEALIELHLEPVEVNEAMRLRTVPTDAKQTSNSATFAFEGRDKEGDVRRGTIQETDKRRAFERLRDDQGLTVTILSPVGIPPLPRDPDLEKWQSTSPSQTNLARNDWNHVDEERQKALEQAIDEEPSETVVVANREYYPLVATLRLYAGWLLAWYALFAAWGYYSVIRDVPIDLPIVRGFYDSPLVGSFMLAIFVLLLVTSLTRALRGGMIIGTLLFATGAAGVAYVTMVMRGSL